MALKIMNTYRTEPQVSLSKGEEDLEQAFSLASDIMTLWARAPVGTGR